MENILVDDSWEKAAQAALDIHRLAMSAVSQSVTAGVRKVGQSATVTRPRQGGRTRPVSAPPRTAKRRSPDIIHDYSSAFLVPNLTYVSTSNTTDGAEHQAWAILGDSSVRDARLGNNIMRRSRLSKSKVRFDADPPSNNLGNHHPKGTAWTQPKQQEGMASAARSLQSRTPSSSLGRTGSSSSSRFLREHTRKARKEEQSFLRMISAEAKEKDDSHVVMIHEATQRCRELGVDVTYSPKRVGGKLHVLKIINSFAGSTLDCNGGRAGDVLRDLEDRRKLITIGSFVKGDFARLKKCPSIARCGTVGNTGGGVSGSTKLKQSPKCMGESSREHVRARPDAAETCQELHQLIRGTVRLVDVLTAQAVELEGQGWNRSPEHVRIAQQAG